MKFLSSSLFVLTFILSQLPSVAVGQNEPLIQIHMDSPRVSISDKFNPQLDTLFCGPCTFFIPKVFTPKADQVKGGWRIKPLCSNTIKSYKLEVFNRWGEFLFETNDISDSWSGKHKGKYVQPGQYIYKISIKVQSNNKLVPANKTGQINVYTPVSD